MKDKDMICTQHDDLVEHAARWLRKKHAVVITEIAGGSETPDAIGFQATGHTTLIECKTSRRDFLTDQKKFFRGYAPGLGMGAKRYYLTPPGLLGVDELPKNWGLLELRGKRIYTVWDAIHVPKHNKHNEISILISLIRRIGRNPVDGVSVRFYTYSTKNKATAGVEI